MVLYRVLEKEDFPFTADTDDIEILYERYIHELQFGITFQQTGTTAPTLSEALGVLSKIEIKLRGAVITEITGQDLMAFDCLFLGHEPLYSLPSADTEYGYIEGLRLPLTIPAGAGTLAYRLFYTAQTPITNYKINICRVESEEVLEEGIYAIKRFDFTPPSTGAENIALDTTFDGDLHAFLIYSTTIPTASSTNATVKKIILERGTTQIMKSTIFDLRTAVEYPRDSTIRGVVDNYILIDLRKNPIPAGERVRLKIVSDDTNAVRIIPITKTTR